MVCPAPPFIAIFKLAVREFNRLNDVLDDKVSMTEEYSVAIVVAPCATGYSTKSPNADGKKSVLKLIPVKFGDGAVFEVI
jgi:hypothetical protein